MDKKDIEKEAKEILDKFAKALEKIEERGEEFYVDREEFERQENNKNSCVGFKELVLENAPKKNKDFIVAEKGDWK